MALVVLLIGVIQMRKSVLLAAGNLIGGLGGGGGWGRRGALMEGIKNEGDNKNTKIKW